MASPPPCELLEVRQCSLSYLLYLSLEKKKKGVAARGPPVGVLRSVAHRRAESVPVLGRFHHRRTPCLCLAFVLGLGARHRGIVELSEGVIRCVTVFACYSSLLPSWRVSK